MPTSTSTSETRTHHGSVEPTRTPTVSSASTSPKAPISADTHAPTWTLSLQHSTVDPARPSAGRPPPRPSTNTYTLSNKAVLRRPLEPGLAAAVGVEHHTPDLAATGSDRFAQRISDERGLHMRCHRDTSNSAGCQVQDERQVEESLTGSNVGDVANPGFIRPSSAEVASQQVRDPMSGVRGGGYTPLAGNETCHTVALHQPHPPACDSPPAHADAARRTPEANHRSQPSPPRWPGSRPPGRPWPAAPVPSPVAACGRNTQTGTPPPPNTPSSRGSLRPPQHRQSHTASLVRLPYPEGHSSSFRAHAPCVAGRSPAPGSRSRSRSPDVSPSRSPRLISS